MQMLNTLVSLLVLAGSSGPQNGTLTTIIELASGIFAFALMLLSLYSWSRRRHNSLLIFSLAFLVYFLNIVIDALRPFAGIPSELVVAVLNFVVLSLFFIALVIGSGRRRLAAPEKRRGD